MTVPTNVRAGRAAALFAIVQSAKGTPAADLTAAGATRLWTEDSVVWIGPDVSVSPWMDNPQDNGIDVSPDRPEGSLVVKGTYSSLKWLLESNYGALSAGAFTLATGIADTRWLTLAQVEDRFGAGTVTRKLVRIQDAWIHKLGMEWSGAGAKHLICKASYAGRKVLTQAQNAGGITFPAAPMQPSDRDMFPTANTTLVRMVGRRADVTYRFRTLRVTFDQGLGMDWDMGQDMYSVYKAGALMAELEFTADWCDETWTLVNLSRLGTEMTFQITSTAEDGAVLTVTLDGVVLNVAPGGARGQESVPFHAKGIATEVLGVGFVTVGLAA